MQYYCNTPKPHSFIVPGQGKGDSLTAYSSKCLAEQALQRSEDGQPDIFCVLT